MILLIDNYDSFTYNLYQALRELGAAVVVRRNDEVDSAAVARLAPDRIVISPGPGRPEEAGEVLAILRAFASRVPVLGVCLGHQALALAFGGRVVRARRTVHGKPSAVRHDGGGVYRGIENPFRGGRYHSLVVDRNALPFGFSITAEAEDGTVMGIRHASWPAEGVQFHPESVMTEHGGKLLRNFLEA
ncbi:MAG: aminodeoxychorismate/anthranilate synthase component II [Acidobacteriia bacterium]|nr:aminodeoxychorismate/anthranilate synthase component II [Terriglobia bacterium]